MHRVHTYTPNPVLLLVYVHTAVGICRQERVPDAELRIGIHVYDLIGAF